jgi:hypothetical protein
LKFSALFLAAAALAFADGGSVLLQQQSGPFLITVFGAAQTGPNDFSVLLQDAQDRAPILDAGIELTVSGVTVRATHAQATNKLLYAAIVHIRHPGPNRLFVKITRGAQSSILKGAINVAASTPPWIHFWPYFALVPAAVALFALNQFLKARRRR